MAEQNRRVRNDKAVQPEIVSLLDEAIALVPGTDVEVAVLERYGGESWKERMLAVREKLTEVRGRVIAVQDSD